MSGEQLQENNKQRHTMQWRSVPSRCSSPLPLHSLPLPTRAPPALCVVRHGMEASLFNTVHSEYSSPTMLDRYDRAKRVGRLLSYRARVACAARPHVVCSCTCLGRLRGAKRRVRSCAFGRGATSPFVCRASAALHCSRRPLSHTRQLCRAGKLPA